MLNQSTAMRKFSLLLASVLIVAFSFANNFAEGKEKLARKPKKGVHPLTLVEQINHYVQYPTFAAEKNMEGTVRMSYLINEKNQLQVLDIQSPDSRLKEYVMAQIDGKIVAVPAASQNTVKYLKLKFKLY